ncbi:MAG: hypothetical protein JWL76_232 [Thermoleophilia bacterium]|nr:hypothetical protein [Thermoleophilia bacterium]
MRRSSHSEPRTAAIDRLVQAGRAAMPDASSMAAAHLGAVSVAVASEQSRAPRLRVGTRGVPRRRVVLAGAMAALVAIPSLAFAGVLPDPLQRVASNVAASIGVDVPSPHAERARARADHDATADERRGGADRSTAGGASTSKDGSNTTPGDTRGHVNGEQPGKPADGEERGNRFGQVPGGPDQGKAGQPKVDGAKPATPPRPDAPKPAKDPKPSPAKPAAPAPATPAPVTPAPETPEPATPSNAGNGNSGGTGNGNGH